MRTARTRKRRSAAETLTLTQADRVGSLTEDALYRRAKARLAQARRIHAPTFRTRLSVFERICISLRSLAAKDARAAWLHSREHARMQQEAGRWTHELRADMWLARAVLVVLWERHLIRELAHGVPEDQAFNPGRYKWRYGLKRPDEPDGELAAPYAHDYLWFRRARACVAHNIASQKSRDYDAVMASLFAEAVERVRAWQERYALAMTIRLFEHSAAQALAA